MCTRALKIQMKIIWIECKRNTWICKIGLNFRWTSENSLWILCASIVLFFRKKSVDILSVVSTAIFRYQKCKLNGFGRQRSFIYVSRERPEIVQQNSSFSYVYVFQYAQFSSYTLCFFFLFFIIIAMIIIIIVFSISCYW